DGGGGVEVGDGQSAEFVVAVQQVADGALGKNDAAGTQGLVDLGDASVLGVAQGAREGDDVESELVVWQREAALGLGAQGAEEQSTGGAVATSYLQAEAGDALQSGEGAPVVVIDVGGGAAAGAGRGQRGQGGVGGRLGSSGLAGHRSSLLLVRLPDGILPIYNVASQACCPRKNPARLSGPSLILAFLEEVVSPAEAYRLLEQVDLRDF